LLDAEDGSWVAETDIESPMTLTLTADQPVYDSGVLTVNISWSAGQSRALYLDSCNMSLEYCVDLYIGLYI